MAAILMHDYLAELNCEVVGPADSIPDALNQIGSTRIDAAIIDISIGKDTSYPVAELLQVTNIPFAFATGHGEDGVPDRFKDSLVLPKPFAFRDMSRMVDALLQPSVVPS